MVCERVYFSMNGGESVHMDLLEDVQVWCVRGCEGVSESECVIHTIHMYFQPIQSCYQLTSIQ